MYRIELAGRDGSLELAKYWLQKALNIDSGNLDQDTTNTMIGLIQYDLAQALLELYHVHYCSHTSAGRTVPFPQVLCLLGKASKNGAGEAAEKMKEIDHHWHDSQFATASDSSVQIWTPECSAPVQTHSDLWGAVDTVNVVRYNPTECNLLAHCNADRGIGLFDIRTETALKKVVSRMRSNCLEWNPMEPMNFVVGNEDYQAYMFDVQKLGQPTRIYKGYQGAIMWVSWSPTGREFVTGSYDHTL